MPAGICWAQAMIGLVGMWVGRERLPRMSRFMPRLRGGASPLAFAGIVSFSPKLKSAASPTRGRNEEGAATGGSAFAVIGVAYPGDIDASCPGDATNRAYRIAPETSCRRVQLNERQKP